MELWLYHGYILDERVELAISWLLDERVELWLYLLDKRMELWLYHGYWIRGWNSGYIMAIG